MNTIADFLDQAADYIIEHGHCKGDLTSEGRVCALGALDAVARAEFAKRSMTSTVLVRGELSLGRWAASQGYEGVVSWNDHPETTMDDVIDGMRTVAKELRNG